MSAPPTVVLSRSRQASAREVDRERALLAGFERERSLRVVVVPHLYDLAPDGPAMQALRTIHGDLIVLAWLYLRSVHWVLDANQIHGKLGRTISLAESEPLGLDASPATRPNATERTIWCLDLRSNDEPSFFLQQIQEIAGKDAREIQSPATGDPDGRIRVVEEPTRARWYPVVDMHRCTDCMECLNFCLFGVYGQDADGRLLVEDPDACRPGCPACARICPAGAIMFPEHSDAGIAGDARLSLEGLKLDLSQIFAGIDPTLLAAREREQALAQAGTPAPPSAGEQDASPAAKSTLDQLVNRVDEFDV